MAGVVCEGDVCRMADLTLAQPRDDGHPIISLLGPTLVEQQSELASTEIAGPGKFVGLYFSAHWCPPCRAFTPKLAEFYQKFKASHAQAANFDIVFVSSDRAEADFASYYRSMPWKALPFKERDLKAKLSQKFKVPSIPMLIILDANTGAVVTTEARRAVENDPDGASFPWVPPSLDSLLQGPVTNAKGESKSLADVSAGKVTAVYFSAHWCPPCRAFTPHLAELYRSFASTDKAFEVIWVSRDRDEKQFQEYLGEMPWFAIPYNDSQRRNTLSDHFQIQSIPSLILLSQDDWKVITSDGTSCLRSDPQGADFPWAPQPVEKLSAIAVPRLNDGDRCFILFVDDYTPAGVQRAEELLIDEALRHFSKPEPDTFFYVADKSAKLSKDLLDMMGVSEPHTPQLLMLELPTYAVGSEVRTTEDVAGFVSDCLSGKCEIKSLE